jgi:hypothetical protein
VIAPLSGTLLYFAVHLLCAGAASAGSLAARGAGHSWHGERVVEAAKAAGGEQALLDLVKR